MVFGDISILFGMLGVVLAVSKASDTSECELKLTNKKSKLTRMQLQQQYNIWIFWNYVENVFSNLKDV